VRRIVDECYRDALDQLRENRERLDTLAAALVEHETLDEADIYRIADIERRRELLPDEQVPEVAAEDGRVRR
jgi:cell division protease FtsH